MNSLDETLQKYGDIIDLEHPTSRKHKRMSRENRAAQFAPFAALTGFEGAVDDTARFNETIYENELGQGSGDDDWGA